jgi:hypothetical protein
MSFTLDENGDKVFSSPAEMFKHMSAITSGDRKLVRNYHGIVADMTSSSIVVETELFPKDALTFYSRYNLDVLDLEGNEEDKALYAKWYSPARGGGQGDYRKGMKAKVDNVVDCLTKFPKSKRAVITIPNTACIDHTSDEEAKCLRELHFYLEGLDGPTPTLCCTGFMRAQAATIFPKNIHYEGTLMNIIASRLGVKTGYYAHNVTTLIDGRET